MLYYSALHVFLLISDCNSNENCIAMFDGCNKLIVANLTNEILRNANEIHFIPCDIMSASNSFNVIHELQHFLL